jgi:hypothetical protein
VLYWCRSPLQTELSRRLSSISHLKESQKFDFHLRKKKKRNAASRSVHRAAHHTTTLCEDLETGNLETGTILRLAGLRNPRAQPASRSQEIVVLNFHHTEAKDLASKPNWGAKLPRSVTARLDLKYH